MNYLALCEFDGAEMEGWQSQPSGNTVQDKLESAIERITRHKTVLTGVGRTDSGVSALNYPFNFKTDYVIKDKMGFMKSVNAVLPDTILIKSVRKVKDDFNARFDCRYKTYCYNIYLGRSPLVSRHWQIAQEPDLKKMKQFIEGLEGRHDFSTFCRKKSLPKNPVIEMKAAVMRKKGREIFIILTGDRFLHNTVRLIAGTAVDIGLGRINMTASEMLMLKDVKFSGRTAPAEALLFYKAYY